MATSGQVVRLAHESVRAPGHGVCDARCDLETASWTGVWLRGARRRERLHVPQAVAARLGAPLADEGATEVQFLSPIVRTASTRTVRARHASSLRSAAAVHLFEAGLLQVEHRLGLDQYSGGVDPRGSRLEQGRPLRLQYLASQGAVLALR